MSWKVIACSETGTSHQKLSLPCQDYANFIKVSDFGKIVNNGDIIIGAVSDGAGSCKHSDVGSQLAVTTALNYLQKWPDFLKDKNKDSCPEILKESANKVFQKTLTKVQEAFNGEAENRKCSPKDLSCTLLVVVVTPNWLAAMQIGDGFIVIQQPESEYQLLFHPTKGEYANETTFVTASNALEMMQVEISFGAQEFICASTDGLERLAINIKDWQPHAPFFEMFKKALKIRSEEEEKISTQEWLKSEEINKRTDDDKTLLLCWYDSGVKTLPASSGGKKSNSLEEQCFSDVPKKSGHQDNVSSNLLLLINVLLGIVWNAIYHDLFFDITIDTVYLRLIISLLIASIFAMVIFIINWNIYEQKLKNIKSEKQQIKLLFFIMKISSIGLGLGGIFYYLIHQYIRYIVHVS